MQPSPVSTRQHHHRQQTGFILPITVIIGLIVAIGGVAMLARSFAGLYGATRQGQARQARELAETGLATTMELLNRKYSYLLINCSGSPPTPNECINTGTWTSPKLPSSICSGADTTASNLPLSQNISSPKGRYQIEYYAYAGTQFYGGTGRLKVKGERLSSDGTRVLATATVEQTFDVKPKPCDASFGQPPTSSGFPGLMGWKVNLGNNDVKGVTSGNVLCITCTVTKNADGTYTQAAAETAVGALNNSDVDGNIFIGEISPPDALTFPSNLLAYVTKKSITAATTITAASTATTSIATNNNNGMCATDVSNPKITHCLIDKITLSGQKMLRVDTTAGPVRLYISGDVSASGQAGILHTNTISDPPEPSRLALFGNPLSSDAQCRNDPNYTNQTVTLAGTSSPAKAASLFAYFPCGQTGINGGAQATATCDSSGECGGGDIYGAIWTKIWNASSSNQAQLVVPKDMGSELLENFGTQFAISIHDYAALGINSWSGFQGVSQ